MSERIAIQATFSGYAGVPCTLFSAYDVSRRILFVAKEAKLRPDRFERCIVITNDSAVTWDRLFTDDDMMRAISAYHALKQGVADDGITARLAFSDKVQRANPDGAIDRDGIDASGPRYRISDGMTCAQAAALATCLYAHEAGAVEAAVSMADRLQLLLSGDILTI